MIRWHPAAVLAAAPLTAAFLAGCGHSPATVFLVLDPAPATAPVAAYRGPPLRVPFVHLPVTLDRPEPVRQDAAGTLIVDDVARWSAPLGLMARDTLIQDLIARLPAGTVLPPDAPAAAPERRVEVTVLAFAGVNNRAILSVAYRFGDAAPRLVQLSAPLPAEAPADRARAWSALLAQLADRLVADLPDR